VCCSAVWCRVCCSVMHLVSHPQQSARYFIDHNQPNLELTFSFFSSAHAPSSRAPNSRDAQDAPAYAHAHDTHTHTDTRMHDAYRQRERERERDTHTHTHTHTQDTHALNRQLRVARDEMERMQGICADRQV